MNIIVTGASRGIGFQIVRKLAENPENHVFAIARNKPKLEELQQLCNSDGNPNVYIKAFDLQKHELDELMKSIKAQFTRLDGLINNAGGLLKKSFNSITPEEALDVFNINFFGPVRLIQECIPLLKNSPAAHVVNISSMAGFQGSSKFPGLTLYGASKAAIASLTEGLAAEYKDSGIHFNALSLGAVSTEMLAEAFPGLKAPVSAAGMGKFIADFVVSGHKVFNGQVIPVNLSNL